MHRYHQTKLANPVLAMVLHERLQAAGSRVKSVCAEPGVAATALGANLAKGHAEAGNEIDRGSSPYTPQSAADGAAPLMAAAFGAGVESGDFFMPGDFEDGTKLDILRPQDVHRLVMQVLNPDGQKMSRPEAQLVARRVFEFKEREGLAHSNDIKLYHGFLSRGGPRRFMHGLIDEMRRFRAKERGVRHDEL